MGQNEGAGTTPGGNEKDRETSILDLFMPRGVRKGRPKHFNLALGTVYSGFSPGSLKKLGSQSVPMNICIIYPTHALKRENIYLKIHIT